MGLSFLKSNTRVYSTSICPHTDTYMSFIDAYYAQDSPSLTEKLERNREINIFLDGFKREYSSRNVTQMVQDFREAYCQIKAS